MMTFMEEYQNIEKGMGLITLDDSVLRFEGKDLSKFLQGILSNDLRLLTANQSLCACFLNAKGKWIAALQLFQVESAIFAKTSPLEAKNLLQAIQALILFSDSKVEDKSEEYQWILGIGAQAHAWLADQKLAYPSFQCEGYRLPSFLILCPRAEMESWMASHASQGISPETLEVLRIESCLPLYGQDVDDKTIPIEAGLDSHISYTKGCYVGQETISRIKHYGRVNKRLVRVKIRGQEIPKIGDDVSLQDKDLGKISSLCYSPFFQTNLALSILSQEAKAGDLVKISAGRIEGEVVE